MSTKDTTASTVPTIDEHPGLSQPTTEDAAEGGNAFWYVLGVLLALLLGAIAFVGFAPASWVGITEYVLAPGSATNATPSISVVGADSHPPEGKIAFTTVTIRRDITLWDWWRAKRDGASELVAPETIDGDRTTEETRQVTQFQMDQSQDLATLVALDFLGYEIVPEIEGAFVVRLVDGSPAQAALRLGDLITRVDDAEIRSSEDLGEVIGSKAPGEEVDVVLRRSVASQGGSGADPDAVDAEEPIVLAEHPDNAGAGFLGVQIETPVKADAPFDVTIDVGRVRGPSAGLAFSLSILDVLTEGELTGGKSVATTGTIDRAGLVGPVGGVLQKTEAAADSGIDLFLVPPSEYVEASEAADGRLEVRCVQTFDDAVLALADYGGNGTALAEGSDVERPQESPSLVDLDDGYFSCAEAEVELDGSADGDA